MCKIKQIQSRGASTTSQTPRGKSHCTLKSENDGLASLFEKFSSQEDFNFLDVMSALSDMVVFYIDCDLKPERSRENKFSMSQNKCRFCY